MHISVYLVACHDVFEEWDAYFYILGRVSWGFGGMGCIFLYIWSQVMGLSRHGMHARSHVPGFSGHGMHISVYLTACHRVFNGWGAYFYIFGRMSRGFRGVGCIFLYIWPHVTGFSRHGMHISIYMVACHGVLRNAMHISVY